MGLVSKARPSKASAALKSESPDRIFTSASQRQQSPAQKFPIGAAGTRISKDSHGTLEESRPPGNLGKALTGSQEPDDSWPGHDVPPILKPSCSKKDRFILYSHWCHRRKTGDAMWNSIEKDYKQEFLGSPGISRLQYRLERARSKYIDPVPQDFLRLREGWLRVEQSQHQMIQETSLEPGGSKNMRSSADDIECKVENGVNLDEGLYMKPSQTTTDRQSSMLPPSSFPPAESKSDPPISWKHSMPPTGKCQTNPSPSTQVDTIAARSSITKAASLTTKQYITKLGSEVHLRLGRSFDSDSWSNVLAISPRLI
ncbi:hypothetical protein ACJZ2D_013850 [Fusarium nematophilum]